LKGTLLVHATAVALDGGAILLRGPSGAGKSDLGLRLIDAGARLVADDQVELRRAGREILARAPAALAGRFEIRGVGIVPIAAVNEAPLVLIVDLIPAGEIERLPEPRVERVLGVAIPLVALTPFEASAAAKLAFVRRALAMAPPPAANGA
jgi:HPr kinase/phosphorylase